MVYKLYNAAVCDKELLIVKEANHGESYGKFPKEYEAIISSFFNKYLSN